MSYRVDCWNSYDWQCFRTAALFMGVRLVAASYEVRSMRLSTRKSWRVTQLGGAGIDLPFRVNLLTRSSQTILVVAQEFPNHASRSWFSPLCDGVGGYSPPTIWANSGKWSAVAFDSPAPAISRGASVDRHVAGVMRLRDSSVLFPRDSRSSSLSTMSALSYSV